MQPLPPSLPVAVADGTCLLVIGADNPALPGVVKELIERRGENRLDAIRIYDATFGPSAEAAALCERLAATRPVSVERVRGDLALAMGGVDAVLLLDSVDDLEGDDVDESVPPMLGLPGGPRIGPGAVLRGLRRAPRILRVVRAMELGAPDATLILAVPPAHLLVRAVAAMSPVRVIGLTGDERREVATLAGRPAAEIGLRCAGIGPLAWYHDVRVDGELVDLSEDTPEPAWLSVERRTRLRIAHELAADVGVGWPSATLADLVYPSRMARARQVSGGPSSRVRTWIPTWYRYVQRLLNTPGMDLDTQSNLGWTYLGRQVSSAIAPPRCARPITGHVAMRELVGRPSDEVVRASVLAAPDGWDIVGTPFVPARFRSLWSGLSDEQLRFADAVAVQTDSAAVAAIAADPLVSDEDTASALWAKAKLAYAGVQ